MSLAAGPLVSRPSRDSIFFAAYASPPTAAIRINGCMANLMGELEEATHHAINVPGRGGILHLHREDAPIGH